MQHLDEGTIHAWLDGALDAEEASRVEQHVAGCATCAAAVAEARGLVAGASRILSALDDTPSVLAPRSSGGSTTRRSSSLWNTLHLTPGRRWCFVVRLTNWRIARSSPRPRGMALRR
jgi:anti-sigma factor RsiW